jgi:hypothetical protein
MQAVNLFQVTVNGEPVTFASASGEKFRFFDEADVSLIKAAIKGDEGPFEDTRAFYRAQVLGTPLDGAVTERRLAFTEYRDEAGYLIGRVFPDGRVDRSGGGTAAERVAFCEMHDLNPAPRDKDFVRLNECLDEEGRAILKRLMREA